MTVSLTPREQAILERLADCWNLFINLSDTTQADRIEFENSTHRLQHLIMARAVRRAYPELFHQTRSKS